jgi:hypothetical protein
VLGVTQLHDLVCLEELRVGYDLDLPTIHRTHQEATESGEMNVFVRWTTDKLLEFSGTSEVREANITNSILEAMKGTIAELQHATVVEDASIQDKGLPQADVARFRELSRLLRQCFDLLCDSLSSEPGSRLGTQELVRVAREIDFVGGPAVEKVRKHGSALHEPRSARVVSNAILEQLNEWHHPLRLEIALSTMLEALPKLEESVFRKMKVDAWRLTLVRHGMEDDATTLATALNESRTAAVPQSAAKSAISSHPQASAQTSDPTPRAKAPNASRVKKNTKKADKIDMRAVGYFDISSDYSYASMTPDITPAPGPTFSEVFKPTQRRPMRAITAGSRRRFEGRLMGGEPVATPGTVASSRCSSVAPTPILQGPRALRKVGKGRRRAKVQGTIDEEGASEGDESDEEDRGNEAISVAGSWTSDQYGNVNGGHCGEEEMSGSEYSSEGYEDVDGDSEMGNSSE